MEEEPEQRTLLPAVAPLASKGLLVEIGPQTRSRMKRLKRGRGRLTRAIMEAVSEACNGIDSAAQVVPVVILYRRREREQ